ncbi:MAG: hypothetical protein MUE50_04355 [Pirellulaceae bacterium]|nr:hypothetical protein [Pirellulaceae bacterium]
MPDSLIASGVSRSVTRIVWPAGNSSLQVLAISVSVTESPEKPVIALFKCPNCGHV